MARYRKRSTHSVSKQKTVRKVKQTPTRSSSTKITISRYMKSAAQILHEEKLSFKLLDACAYVDMRDVTINPYDFMRTSESTEESASVDNFVRNLSLKRKATSHNVHEQIIIVPSDDCHDKTTSLIIDIESKSPLERGTRRSQRLPSTGSNKKETSKVVTKDSPAPKQLRRQIQVTPSVRKSNRKQKIIEISDDETEVQESNEESSEEVTPSKRGRKTSRFIDSDVEPDEPLEEEKKKKEKEQEKKQKQVHDDSDVEPVEPQEEEKKKEREHEKKQKQVDDDNDSDVFNQDTDVEHDTDQEKDVESDREKEAEKSEVEPDNVVEDAVNDNSEVEKANDEESEVATEENVEENSEVENVADVDDSMNVDEIRKVVVGLATSPAPVESIDILSSATSTQELFDILADKEIPQVSSENAFPEAPNEAEAAKEWPRFGRKLTSGELVADAKRITAEAGRLLAMLPLSDDDPATGSTDSEPSHTPSPVEDKENMHSNDDHNTSLNNSMTKKRTPYKIRFKKSFEYSKHACTDCKKLFRSNVDLQLHCLQHMDSRNLSVRVFRAILPSTFNTAKHNMNRYLKPRPKTPVAPIDVDAIKNLVGKYCKNDSFLEPFDSPMEGDISQSATEENATPEELNQSVTVLSDLTIVSGDKPQHVVEINEDQLEAYAIGDVVPETQEALEEEDIVVVPQSQEEGTQVTDINVVPESQEDDTQENDIDVEPESQEMDVDIVPETQKVLSQIFEIEQTVSDDDDIIPATQDVADKDDDVDEGVSEVNDEAIYEMKIDEDSLVDEGEETDATQSMQVPTQGEETHACSDSPIAIEDSSDESPSSTETVVNTTLPINVDDDSEQEVQESNNIDDDQSALDAKTSDNISFHVSDDVSSEADTSECTEKKRKRDSTDELKYSSDVEQPGKRPRLSDENRPTSRTSNTTDDFISCTDASSSNEAAHSLISEDNSVVVAEPDASPSKCSETSEGDNPEHLLKLAKLDNQLQKIIDNHKIAENASELMSSTMNDEDLSMFSQE